MKLTEEDITLIIKAVDNTLTESERNLLHKKVNNSEEFSKELQLAKSVAASIEASYQNDKRNEIKRIYEQAKKKGLAPARRHNQRYMYWAAAVIVLLMSSYFVFIDSTSKQQLFDNFYEPYPASPEVRSNNATDITPVMKSYSKEDYEKAIKGFEEYLSKHPEQPSINLFLGCSYLGTDQHDKAILTFNPLIKNEDKIIAQHAQWYLSLSHLKADNLSDARKNLNYIISQGTNHIYYESSIELEDKID